MEVVINKGMIAILGYKIDIGNRQLQIAFPGKISLMAME